MKKILIPQQWILIPLLLIFAGSCRKDPWGKSPVIEKEFNLNGFSGVHAATEINLIIIKGATFAIKAKGEGNFVEDLELKVANNMLDIAYKNYVPYRPQVDVYITLPTLELIDFEGAVTGSVTGFANEPYVTQVSLASAKLTMTGAPFNVHIDLAGSAEFTVSGITTSLYGTLSGGSKLEAYDLAATEVDISASSQALARVKATNTLFASATGANTRIYYKGNPPVKQLEAINGGQVIQE